MQSNPHKLTVIDGETLMDKRLPPTKFCVDTLLPQGLCILGGSPKHALCSNILMRRSVCHLLFVLPFCKPCLCSCRKICILSPIIEVSFAYFSFQRKVRCLLFFKEKYGQGAFSGVHFKLSKPLQKAAECDIISL